MNPQATTAAQRQQRWTQYLDELQEFAAAPQELQTAGTLVRVTGLVLEAAGVRASVGSLCEVISEGQPTVMAEVVGFNGDRAFLMPTGPLYGLASGARVVPRHPPNPRRSSAVFGTPGGEATIADCTCPWAQACSDVWWMPMAYRWTARGR